MAKILVTGGTGYIGSHTVIELIKADYEPIIVDNLCNSKELVLDRIKEISGVRPKFYKADVCDENKMREIFKAEKFNDIIHFAGLKSVAESVKYCSIRKKTPAKEFSAARSRAATAL